MCLSTMKWPADSCVRARASEEAGVNVERPEPKARTNDVDAGDERRRLSQEPARGECSLVRR